MPGASTAVSSPKSCLSSTIRDNAPTKMVAPLLACWPWAREAQVPIWHPQPEGQGDSLVGVSCLRGPEPADPKSCKAGSQRPLGLLNLRHVGASPAPAPCFPHPRVAPAEDVAPQGHLPGARTAPWRPAPIPQGRPGMTGRRSGGVAGYENHSSRGQPRDGLRRPGRHLQVRSSPGQTLLLRAPRSAAWTAPRTPRGKRCQAEAVTKAAACVHVHGSKHSGGRDVVGSSAGSEHGSAPATPI